jgi:hypothetical protein
MGIMEIWENGISGKPSHPGIATFQYSIPTHFDNVYFFSPVYTSGHI